MLSFTPHPCLLVLRLLLPVGFGGGWATPFPPVSPPRHPPQPCGVLFSPPVILVPLSPTASALLTVLCCSPPSTVSFVFAPKVMVYFVFALKVMVDEK